MKRTLLDITQKISRNPNKVALTPKNLEDSNYWIFQAIGWKFVDLLREIEYRETQDRIKLYINTQSISAKDYIVERDGDGLIIKFIKNLLPVPFSPVQRALKFSAHFGVSL